MITGWIPQHNLQALIDFLSFLVGYSFDRWDWDAIEYGLTETDADRDIWYEHPLQGERTLKVAITVPPGSCIVNLRIEGDPDIEAKAEVAVMIAQEYNIRISH